MTVAAAAAIADALRGAGQDTDDVSWRILLGHVKQQIKKRCPSIDEDRFINRCWHPFTPNASANNAEDKP